MKKKIFKQDGTVEELEGTAEELSEYERKNGPLKEDKPGDKPGLLQGHGSLSGIATFNFRGFQRAEHASNCDVVAAQRGYWSIIPPRCTCGLIAYPSTGFYIATSTGTN